MTERHTVQVGSDQELDILSEIEKATQDIKNDSETTAGRTRI
jgi:hypothetical protein